MCLSIPAKVLALQGDEARVDVDGNELTASLALVDDVKIGDYVLVHAGYAIEKYEPAEAEETLAMLKQALEPPGQ